MVVHNSANDIINTFNHFFTNVPANKSFDMTYKVYIRDLADIEDRATLSARSSSVNIPGTKPITIASHGVVPTASSTGLDLSLMSIPATKVSSTNVTAKETTKSDDTLSLSEIDRICAENMARKERSMVQLAQLNEQFGAGCPPPPPFAATPPTVYENLSILSSKSSEKPPGPNMIIQKIREFEKMKAKEDSEGDKLFIKVADCFN